MIQVPAFSKILLCFLLMLSMSRFLPLYLCILLGSVAVGVMMHLTITALVTCAWQEVTSPQTLYLALVIGLILVLSGLLRESGHLHKIVASLEKLSLGSRFAAILLPALIGLLPFPGGAVFSAPMVATALDGDSVAPEVKAAANYWFRHIWEFSWPLCPAIILGASVLGISPWSLIIVQIPLCLGSLLAGMAFILPHIPAEQVHRPGLDWKALKEFTQAITPITMVIAVLLGIQGVRAIGATMNLHLPWPEHVDLFFALAAGFSWTVPHCSPFWTVLCRIFFSRALFSMVIIVLAVMIFKGVLIATGAIDEWRSELAALGIHFILIIALLPLISGFVTGLGVGFVGSSFPLITTLFPDHQSWLPIAVLAYGFGFTGMMLSPIHLCFVVSQRYFCAEMLKGYRYLWRPVVSSVCGTVLLFFIYRMSFG